MDVGEASKKLVAESQEFKETEKSLEKRSRIAHLNCEL
jgi:hypothetical protein